jgi:hypothetical protein
MRISDSTKRFREQSRREIPRLYSGKLHFAFTNLVMGSAIFIAYRGLHRVRPAEWLTIGFTFLAANLVEYLAHRGPMHHVFPYLRLVYRNHTLRHHRFFPHDAMAIEETRDLNAVLFPPLMIGFFTLIFLVPVGSLLSWLATPNAARLFLITALVYYLNYEWLHLFYHLPETSPWRRFPLINRLSRLHTLHHDPHLMSHYNFNITYPLTDYLAGTLRGEARRQVQWRRSAGVSVLPAAKTNVASDPGRLASRPG